MKFFLLIVLLISFPAAAQAKRDCTLLVDHKSAEIIHEEGDCGTRHGAQSTFKIPLALMGFDSGILKDARTPSWDYKSEYNSNRKEERAETDPARWEKDSVVWYSQKLTRTLGPEKFKNYVELFNYGNKDISGDPGKNNGLTNSWLSSSLQISPQEQVAFLRGLLSEKFKVSKKSYETTLQIIPQFSTNEWKIHGKTGSGFHRNDDGTINRDLQEGWFVGWAEKNDQKIIFAKFIADDEKTEGYAGPRARDALLRDLPALIDKHQRARH